MSDLDNVYESTDAYQSAYGECPKLQDFSSVSQEKKLVNEEAKKKPYCDKAELKVSIQKQKCPSSY